MSSGPVNPFVDFGSNANDSNENNAASIQPVADGEAVNQTVLTRPTENMRKRSEVLRGRITDSLYIENADRVLVIAGPGKVTWPGSTTAGASGIPVISDTLWLLPMLTPGFAQAAPVPPVASAYGVLHLQRATGPSNAILVTSQRRSYAAGDQINITVTPGSVYSCTLNAEDTGALRRTIKIVATSATTLGTVIASLNALTPPAPDNASALVTAALEGGALAGDLILTSQARQFVSGNYDGEGHAITPANLASFFSGNPSQVLAEGDTLCVAYADLYDTATNGGRRQSIPENSNTTIPSASFFNSRVHPELLYNALPVCKVINGSLVFSTGASLPAGTTSTALTPDPTLARRVVRNGGFERGVSGGTTRYAVNDWEIDQATLVNGVFRKGQTAAAGGRSSLEFNKTAVGASAGDIVQRMWVPVLPGDVITIQAAIRQLIAPTAGTYKLRVEWGDADGSQTGVFGELALQVLASTDASFRSLSTNLTVPAATYSIIGVHLQIAGVTSASTGVAVAFDSVQVLVTAPDPSMPNGIEDALRVLALGGIVMVDPGDATVEGAVARWATSADNVSDTAPVIPNAPGGSIVVERRDQAVGQPPPSLALMGLLWKLGSRMLDTEARALLPRVSADISTVGGVEYTLMWESARQSETVGTYTQAVTRMYGAATGGLLITTNARWDGTLWNKDVAANQAFKTEWKTDRIVQSFREAVTATWTNWVDMTTTHYPGSSQALLELANTDIVPTTDGADNVGQATKAFGNLWTRYARIGPAITSATEKLVQYKSNFGYPSQTQQVDFDYISANWGVLSRKGHRFVQDWDGGTATPGGWTTSSTGGATGSNTLGAAQHRTTVAHDGANVGTFTLQSISSVKFRLTDGVLCRMRIHMDADFTKPYVGFYDVGGAGNGITVGPQTVDGGGSHNVQFAIGAGLTLVGGPGDHVFNSGMRWWTFAVVGTKLWWTLDYGNPDDPGSGTFDSFSIAGSATITVPTGLYHFVVHADGGGGGFGSSIGVDYVEIITGNRDA